MVDWSLRRVSRSSFNQEASFKTCSWLSSDDSVDDTDVDADDADDDTYMDLPKILNW